MAIVVSEETGAISLVVDGQIERGLDPDALRAGCDRWSLQRRQRRRPRAARRSARAADGRPCAVSARRAEGRCRSRSPCCSGWSSPASEIVERGAARAARAPAISRRPRAGRRAADTSSTCACAARRRRSASCVGRRHRRRARSARRPAGPAAVPADARAGARAVRRRGRAGDAGDASRWCSRTRRRSRCRSCPRRRQAGAGLHRRHDDAPIRRRSKSSGPRARSQVDRGDDRAGVGRRRAARRVARP